MATEPVSSASSTVLEQVEQESPEKVKTIEESASELKENDLKAKEEEIPTEVPVPSSESIEKDVDKESKPSIVEEKPQADVSPSMDATSSGPEETKEDKSIEPSPPGDVIVSSVVPVADVSLLDNKESSNDHVAEVDKGDVSGGKDLDKLEEESTKETVVDKPKEIEPSESPDVVAEEEVQVKELLEKTEIPESVIETSNVELEQSNTIIPKEPEVTEVKDVKSSAPGEELSEEKAKITEELKQESVASVDAANDKEIPSEEIKLKNEVEPIEAESTKQDNITTEEAHVEQKGIEVPPTEAVENIDSNETEKIATDVKTEEKKEESAEVDEVKGIDEVSEAEQTSRDIELPVDIEGKKDKVPATTSETNKDVEIEKKVDAEEPQKSVTETKGEDLSEEKAEIIEVAAEATEKHGVDAAKDEESLTDKVEGMKLKSEDNIDAEDPIKPEESNETKDLPKDVKNEDKKEESTMPEQTSREIELPADIEDKKDETLGTAAETEKEVEVEKKVDVEEGEKASKSVEPVPQLEVEQQKEVEENANPDAPIEEAPKEEVPVKQKNSNNLLSKVKQSLVKAKKAIIKKNPSKAPPTS